MTTVSACHCCNLQLLLLSFVSALTYTTAETQQIADTLISVIVFNTSAFFIIVFIITEGLSHLKDAAAVACLSLDGHVSFLWDFGVIF